MTQQEFTKLTGYTPATQEEFQAIHKMYMDAGSMSKEVFCKHWVALHENDLFRTFYYKSKELEKKCERLESVINDAFEMVLDKANDADAHDDFDDIAVVLKDRKSVIRHKLNHNYELTEDDKEYIKTLL